MNYLNKSFNTQPFLAKGYAHGQTSRMSYAGSFVRGYRTRMEDTHCFEPAVLSLLTSNNNNTNNTNNTTMNTDDLAFFGVFDGHLGVEAAKYLEQHLLKDHLLRMNVNEMMNLSDDTIKKEFVRADEEILPNTKSGCVAVTSFIKFIQDKVEVVCANAGDSRCVLCHGNTVIALSEDHKPNNQLETERIIKAESFVFNNRVSGCLAVSRAFGDVQTKRNTKLPLEEQAVIAVPDIARYQFSKSNSKQSPDFLVLACDGLWDKMSREEVCSYIRIKMKEYDIFSNEPISKRPLSKNWVDKRVDQWTEKDFIRWINSRPDGSLTLPVSDFNTLCAEILEILKKFDNAKRYDRKLIEALTLARFILNTIRCISRRINRPIPVTPAEKLELICENLLDYVVISKMSTDNVSAVIVLLHDNTMTPMRKEDKVTDENPCDEITNNSVLSELDIVVRSFTEQFYSHVTKVSEYMKRMRDDVDDQIEQPDAKKRKTHK
jgi:protein phosphatase 2C family protein 2/3